MTYSQLQARVKKLAAKDRASQEVRRKLELTQVLLDNITSLVVVKDAEGRYLLVNNKSESVIGLKSEEIVGKTADEVYPPEIAEKIRELDRKVIESGEIHANEEHLRLGDERIYFTTKVPLLDEEGRCWGICGLATDITQRKKAEEKLREDEDMVKTILNTSAEPMLLLDIDGTIIYLNETAALRFGKPVKELIGVNSLGLIAPELAQSRRNYHDIAIQYRMPVRFEETQAGIIFNTTVYPVFDGKGNVVRLSVWARDISNQKKAEEELREREEKYRALFESLQDAAFIADAETGMIHEANPQAEVLMGYTRDELVSMHQTELRPREEMERYLRMFQERSEKGSGIDLDCEIVRKDSTKVPVMISAHLLAIGGKPYLMGIFRDQSLYKKMSRKKENAGRLEEFNSLALESAREGNQIVVSLLDKIRAQLGSGKLKDGSWELLLEAETELLKMKEVNRKLLSRNGEEES